MFFVSLFYLVNAENASFRNKVWAVIATATWKRRMGLSRTRYIGLAKVTGQILMVAMAFNLRRVASLTA